MVRRLYVFAVIAPLVAGGCAARGPNYQRPTVTPPAAFRGATVTAEQATSIADLPWFEMFREPELLALVREALDHNLDLRAAIARVEEFRGRAALAGADLKPSVSGSFATDAQPNTGTIDNVYTAGLFFNWEIDFFGRLRRASEAARAELLASEEGTRAAMSSVAAGVAQGYTTLRALDDQVEITRRNIQTQEASLELVKTQAAGGIATGAEVQQATTQLASTRAVLPLLERQLGQVENEVSVLLGRAPREVARGSGPTALPTAPEIPVGLPSQLLERRPDIRATEHQLHAAVARIGVALAEKIPIPRIGLTSSFGRISTSLGDLFGSAGTNVFSLGGFIDVPLYDGGRGSAREKIARAQAEQAALDYRQVILQSFREVADALVTIDRIRQEIAENQVRVDASREYLRLTDLRYRGGVVSYLEVLDAQRQLFSAEIDLSESQLTQLLGVIDLYRALGGGWSDDEIGKLMARPATAQQ